MDQMEDHSSGAFRPPYAVHFFLSCHFFSTSVCSILFLGSSRNIKTRPLNLQLKSGWDEMLDDKVPKSKAKPSVTISSTCSSPDSEDDDFKTSTLSYLCSPTAETLGLSGLPVSQKVVAIPKSPTSPPVSHSSQGC
jgi:hypothetical protein